MLDVAWPELIVVGVVALVAIGPEDLPKVMYRLGQWAGKARAMALDVRHAVEQATYEAEIAEKLKRQQAAPPGEDASSSAAKPPPGSPSGGPSA